MGQSCGLRVAFFLLEEKEKEKEKEKEVNTALFCHRADVARKSTTKRFYVRNGVEIDSSSIHIFFYRERDSGPAEI